jgi:CheY-like chemotaxis protein
MPSLVTDISESQSRRQPMGKPRFLIVCDSADRLKRLRSLLDVGEAEITCVSSLQELDRACRSEHDLAIVDVQQANIRRVLKTIRESAGHAGIPLLVARITTEPDLAGVLPKYRAMPCSESELLTLARQQINPPGEQRRKLF